jgi:hypothetical protein
MLETTEESKGKELLCYMIRPEFPQETLTTYTIQSGFSTTCLLDV